MNDGGSAFPHINQQGPYSDGMTLRDYFAAAALKNSAIAIPIDYSKTSAQAQAARCYQMADAMIAERLR